MIIMHTIALDTIHYHVVLSKPNLKSGFRYLKPKWHIAPQPSWQPCICKKGCHNTCNSYIFSDKKKWSPHPPPQIKSSCLHAEMQFFAQICDIQSNPKEKKMVAENWVGDDTKTYSPKHNI